LSLGFILRENLLLCLSYLSLGVSNWAINTAPSELPPELTEDEQLQVAILVSAEEEKRAFPGLEDALTLSVAPPPPPGPPPR
jgi:hypothetical protein